MNTTRPQLMSHLHNEVPIDNYTRKGGPIDRLDHLNWRGGSGRDPLTVLLRLEQEAIDRYQEITVHRTHALTEPSFIRLFTAQQLKG